MPFPKLKSKDGAFCLSLATFFFLFLSSFFYQTPVAAAPFPLYSVIQKNVAFWEEIYGRYTTRQGVVHDARDLGKMYSVIELVDWDFPGSATINATLIRGEKERISNLLAEIAAGKPPRTAEARRIAALFSRDRPASYLQARENIRVQVGQHDRFREGTIRSGRYMLAFKKIFAAHGLPTELAYLPHVESSFNPKAHSKAGAAGLWQFTRSTGSDYLRINTLVDERYDPYLAADAAARLLKKNYQALGTWPLAITAYNYGRAGMLRAMRDKGSYEKIFTSYDQGYFKFAARNFYSEFLAALRVAKRMESSQRYRLAPPESVTSFRLQKATSLTQLCEHLNMTQEHFLQLNPALRKPVVEGIEAVPQGYLVRKPMAKKHQQPTIARQPPQNTPSIRAPKKVAERSQDQNIVYIVQKGDTITSIARKFRVPSRTVIAANNQRSTVNIGVKLSIPRRN
jgi:membrane-bound lytic murein transglycosylase D